MSNYRTHSSVWARPRRPFERERLDREMKLLGEYGLKNKKEIWRVQFTLAKIRAVARVLLTLDLDDPKRVFEGTALLRRLVKLGVLGENEQKLETVLSLTIEKFLERRLQTRVFQASLAKSIHHARVLIKQRHIRVGKRLVDVPSFMVRLDSEKHIEFAVTSPMGSGRPGRVRRKTMKNKANKKEEPKQTDDGAKKKGDGDEEL